MLAGAAITLSLSALAFCSASASVTYNLLGAAALVLATSACIRRWDLTQGLLVELVILMTLASVMVLLLAPRRSLQRTVGAASALLGTLLFAWSSWSSAT